MRLLNEFCLGGKSYCWQRIWGKFDVKYRGKFDYMILIVLSFNTKIIILKMNNCLLAL